MYVRTVQSGVLYVVLCPITSAKICTFAFSREANLYWPSYLRNGTVFLQLVLFNLFVFLFSASGASQGAIDNRIEQAMDLVKNHLMSAVRGEVEDLKEKIVRLEEHMARIQVENHVLREHVPSEVRKY